MHLSLASAPAPAPAPVQRLGTLRLGAPDASGRTFLSAASGIAAAGAGSFWAISDEYGELARFDALGAPGALVAGLPPAEGKQHKPDLESITLLPGSLLLAAGSGSKPGRDRGVALQLDPNGRAVAPARVVDLGMLYAAAADRLGRPLNIEGMAVRQAASGAELLLMHRGMQRGDRNAIIRLDLAAVTGAIAAGRSVPSSAIRGHVELDLGTLRGAPLGLSDARTLPDGRTVFTASAEAGSATADGEILGSAIGILDEQLHLSLLRPLDGPPRKVEGIELASLLDPAADPASFVLVTDPDAKDRPTEVLRVRLD